jgi:hypothetical protein
VPTATSWTDPLRDLRHLVRFRLAQSRRPARLRLMVGVLVVLTLAAMVVPAYLPGAADYEHGRAFDLLLLLPSGYAGFLGLATVSAVASGGGRELVPREEAVAWPIGPATDHAGALLMAPLNIAWLLQGWLLLGATAYVVGPGTLPLAQPIALLWLAFGTALAQLLAWTMEAIRRGRYGVVLTRSLMALVGLAMAGAVVSGRLTGVLDELPTVRLVTVIAAATTGLSWSWVVAVVVLLLLTVVVAGLGVLPARVALRRPARDEQRLETGHYPPRRHPRSELLAMVRVDRASVWRAVSLRRGVILLAAAPGLVALSGDLEWELLTVLPGLVASGAALLFGVNAWCLDGRGGLWRDSLPVAPGAVFAARVWVLLELLLASSAATLVLAGLRAGRPSAAEIAALLCCWLVVALQVVSLSMRWSVRQPFAVDLRSARATPAPPMVMVGYSGRLALSTTVTGLVFSGVAQLADWQVALLVTVPFLSVAGIRLLRARDAWVDPVVRSRVVATVAA